MRYIAWDISGQRIEIEAASCADAAQEYVDGGDWPSVCHTVWHTVYVVEVDDLTARARDVVSRYGDDEDSGPESPEECAACFFEVFDREPEDHEGWSDVCAAASLGSAAEIRITVDPEEPPCRVWSEDLARTVDADDDHDWREVSRRGHGGGVVVVDVCRRCGLRRVTDTWACDPSDGSQGLTSIAYIDDDGED